MVSRELPVRLLSNAYFYPKKILKEIKYVTSEKVCVVDIKLGYIPRCQVKWKYFPMNDYRNDLLFFYVITALTDNPEAKVVQYLLHPQLSETFRLQCGDVIFLRRLTVFPLGEGLSRPYLCIEDASLLKKHASTAKMVREMDEWNDSQVSEIYADINRLYFPAENIYPLNYWFEQAVCFPSIPATVDGGSEEPDAVLKKLEEVYNRGFRISDLESRRNLAIRANKDELLAVVLSVRKPINILDTGANPVRVVVSVADGTGVCDVVLWRKSAIRGVAQVQMGCVVLLAGWTIKNVRAADSYALIHPDAPRVPLELSLDENQPTAMRVFPNQFSKPLRFPDPFHNLVSLEQIERHENVGKIEKYITIIGLIVGISRYHTQDNTSSFHVGRTFVRRWIELWDPLSGATVCVALYANRNLEQQLFFQPNRVLCLTHVMVKHFSCFEQLKFTHVTNSVHTELFLFPCAPQAQHLPDAILVKAQEILTSAVKPELTWAGGCHVFENYLMTEEAYLECSVGRKWGAHELQRCQRTLFFNKQMDFVFPSRIVTIEYCHLPRHLRWKVIGDALPNIEVTTEILWIADSWSEERKRMRAHYGREHLNFSVMNLGFSGTAGAEADYVLDASRFPPTSLLERKSRAKERAAEGTEMAAEVLNHGLYRLTFKHANDDVAVSCLFNAEEEPDGAKLIDIIRLKFQPSRKCLESPVLTQRRSKMRGMKRPEVEGLTEEKLEPWIRVQCISRENLEFTLLYL